jgi:hypothetical protein
LIVEVDITSSSKIREETYIAFGVPEIWRFDGEKTRILQLENNKYKPKDASLFLPLVTAKKMTEFIMQAEKLSRLEWIEKVQSWAREAKS